MIYKFRSPATGDVIMLGPQGDQLLRLIGRDTDVSLRATERPEFDAWRWHEYWVPLDCVIEFKRDVYQRALQELSRFLTWPVSGGRGYP